MWLYHVPFTICVVSVLKIAFCDQKKSLTIISTYYFFSSILRFLTKRGGQVWLKLTRTVFSLVAMLNFYFRFRLISHSNVCQNSSASVARLKTFKFYPSLHVRLSVPHLVSFPLHNWSFPLSKSFEIWIQGQGP